MIGFKEVCIKRKPKHILEKINTTLQVIKKRPYELLEKDIYSSAIIKDSKLYINKHIHNEGLIYLRAKNFEKTKSYLAK